MMKIVECTEPSGLVALMGQRVALFCLNYIYEGKLVGVNETCVMLSEATLVYETGGLCDTKRKDAQPFPNDVYVMKSAVESFTVLK